MTKCPQCGRELTIEDVLIPIEDPDGKVVDCLHMKKTDLDEFIETCKSIGRSPSDVFFELITSFMKRMNEK